MAINIQQPLYIKRKLIILHSVINVLDLVFIIITNSHNCMLIILYVHKGIHFIILIAIDWIIGVINANKECVL